MKEIKEEIQYELIGMMSDDDYTDARQCEGCVFYNPTSMQKDFTINCKEKKSQVHLIRITACDCFYPGSVRLRIPKDKRKNLLPKFGYFLNESPVEISKKSLDFIRNFVDYHQARAKAKEHVFIKTSKEDFGGVLVETKKLEYLNIGNKFPFQTIEELLNSPSLSIDMTLKDDKECQELYEKELKRLTTLILVKQYDEIAQQKNDEINEYHKHIWETEFADKKAYLDAKLKEYGLPLKD